MSSLVNFPLPVVGITMVRHVDDFLPDTMRDTDLDPTIIELLETNWPYDWGIDYGGGVRDITVHQVVMMSDEALLAIPKIGPARLEQIRQAIRRHQAQEPYPEEPR